jgi:TetR/AcrR family transcriptional repressor of nem operon
LSTAAFSRPEKTKGLSGASVSDVMARVGLTVGSFYAHFPSKNVLASEALHHAMNERRQMFLDRFEGREWTDRIGFALREYLTRAHRDDPANGCPLSMVAIEAAQYKATAPAFIEEFTRFAEAFETGQRSAEPSAPREAAIGTLALMVGGMILARATKGTALSDEILGAVNSYGQAALGNLTEPSPKQDSNKRGGSH